MSILGMWTADLQTTDLPSSIIDVGATISSTYARTGTYSFKCQDGRYHFFNVQGTKTCYARIALLIDAPIVSNPLTLFFYSPVGSTNTSHCRLLFFSSSLLIYSPHATLLDTPSITFSVGQWHLVEVYLYVDNSTGALTVKWNDDIVGNFSGIDTQQDASDLVSTFSLYSRPSYTYFDDIMVRDDDWCGAGGLYILTPNSGTATENWTASSGNPEECVDELPSTFTDYIYTDGTISNTEHLFNLSSLPDSGVTIGGVGIFTYAKSDFSSSNKVRNLIYSGSTQDFGSGVLLDATAGWFANYWHLNPDDASAWEDTDIDALQIGVETTT